MLKLFLWHIQGVLGETSVSFHTGVKRQQLEQYSTQKEDSIPSKTINPKIGDLIRI